MARGNVEVVRALFELGPEELLSGRDLGDVLDCDVEWLPAAQSLLAAESYHGHKGVRQFWRDLLSTWEEYVPTPQEFLDFGDRVVVIVRIRARSARGIEINETWSGLFTLRDGRIVRFQGFTDRDGAIEAVSERAEPMSAQNVEVVRGLYARQPVVDLTTLPALLEHLADEVEWLPGIARELQGVGYRGHAGVRQWVEDMVESWDDQWWLEPIEFIDAGDYVIVDLEFRARGRSSGIELASRLIHVWTFREAKIVRFQTFSDKAAALRTLGLPAQDADSVQP